MCTAEGLYHTAFASLSSVAALQFKLSLSSEWKVSLRRTDATSRACGRMHKSTGAGPSCCGDVARWPKESGLPNFSVEDPPFPKEAPKNVPWTPWSINHHLGIPRLPNQRKSWIVSCWLWVRQALKPFWIRYYTRYSRFYVLTACDWDTIHFLANRPCQTCPCQDAIS